MQAARGTSVTPEGGADAAVPDGRRFVIARRRSWLLFAAVAIVLYAADQISKHLAVERLAGQPDKPLIGDLLQLHLTRNPGAAFSLGTEYTVALSVLAIVATVAVLVISLRVVDTLWAIGLGFVLAGITGNLTDRLLREPGPLRGHVIDFLMLPNWPIFNIADMCINIGAAVMLIQVFRGVGLDGERAEAESTADRGEDEPGEESEEDR